MNDINENITNKIIIPLIDKHWIKMEQKNREPLMLIPYHTSINNSFFASLKSASTERAISKALNLFTINRFFFM